MPPSQIEMEHWSGVIERSRPQLDAFADVLRRYAQLIDRVQQYSMHSFLKELDLILPELYLASRRIPTSEEWFDYEEDEADDGEDGSYEDPEEPSGTSSRRFLMLRRHLLWIDQNLEIYDPYRHFEQRKNSRMSTEPIPSSLSDCLSSISNEAVWLLAYEAGSLQDIFEAGFHWREMFDSSAGHYVADGIRSVRSLLYEHSDLSDEDETYYQPLA